MRLWGGGFSRRGGRVFAWRILCVAGYILRSHRKRRMSGPVRLCRGATGVVIIGRIKSEEVETLR